MNRDNALSITIIHSLFCKYFVQLVYCLLLLFLLLFFKQWFKELHLGKFSTCAVNSIRTVLLNSPDAASREAVSGERNADSILSHPPISHPCTDAARRWSKAAITPGHPAGCSIKRRVERHVLTRPSHQGSRCHDPLRRQSCSCCLTGLCSQWAVHCSLDWRPCVASLTLMEPFKDAHEHGGTVACSVAAA